MKRSILFLLLLFFITLPQFVYAQTSPTATSSPTPVTIEYNMPYPGLLPDNPLYGLKVLRDRLISFFISDPLKKSSFDLLQADKRLEGAYYLQKKGRKGDDLVATTVSKAENYFDQSIKEVQQATSMGEDTNPQVDRLRTAALKHRQIITQMKATASDSLQAKLQRELNRVVSFTKMLETVAKQ